MKKVYSYLILFFLCSVSSLINAQQKQPLFVLDLASSKYFKTLFSPRQFNIFEDKLSAFNYQAQWAVYNYSTKKESIDNVQIIKSQKYERFIIEKTVTGSIVYGSSTTYLLDNKNKFSNSLKLNGSIQYFTLVYGRYFLFKLPRIDEFVVYDGNKRLCSRKIDVSYTHSSFRDSKNVLSMVTDSPDRLTEYRYDTLTNTLVKSYYLYDDESEGYDKSYLAYSNEQYIYCLEDEFTKLSVKKRKAQNERLENVMTITLKDYFPNPKTNPLDFIEGDSTFRIVEIKGKLHLVYVFNKKLYCYLLDVPN